MTQKAFTIETIQLDDLQTISTKENPNSAATAASKLAIS
jgi:hypothetical protein